MQSKSTNIIRSRITRDTAELRQRRRRYIRKIAAWLEADRERIYELAERMAEIGLYAKTTCEADKRCGILSALAKVNGYESPILRNRWLLKTGWSAYWGYVGTKRMREKVARRLA